MFNQTFIDMRQFLAFRANDFNIDFGLDGIYILDDIYIPIDNIKPFDFELFYTPNGLALLIDNRNNFNRIVYDLRQCVNKIQSLIHSQIHDVVKDFVLLKKEWGFFDNPEIVDIKQFKLIYNQLQLKYNNTIEPKKPQNEFKPIDFTGGIVGDMLRNYFHLEDEENFTSDEILCFTKVFSDLPKYLI